MGYVHVALVSSTSPSPPNAAHFYVTLPGPDVGSPGGWSAATTLPTGGGFALTTGSTTFGSNGYTLAVAFSYTRSSPASQWVNLLTLGSSLSVTLNAAPGLVAPSLNVSSILVVANTAPGSHDSAYAIFFDPTPTINGTAYVGYGAAHASFAPGGAGSVVVAVDAEGRITSVTNEAGTPYMPIPFPPGAGGGSSTAPATLAPGSTITLGGGSAVSAAFPGGFTSFGIVG